jgi:hypothetical protein
MSSKKTEACGRCSMSTVVDAVSEEEQTDLFGDERIEVDDDQLRRIAPGAWAGRVTARINEIARRLTYGR